MDPSPDPAPDPPLLATIEPAAHRAHAANPTPSHAPNPNHPPYSEMIAAAIAALNEKNGSSRRAIAKYIEEAYKDLPPTHSAQLTRQLKRLKSSGHLLMVKHSYKLPPRSIAPAPGETANGGDISSPGPKRGPGRPPKPKNDAQPLLPGMPNVSDPIQPGMPMVSDAVQPGDFTGSDGVSVATGLDDGLAKRRRGRPPKPKMGSVPVGLLSSGPKFVRGRGRPPRPKSLTGRGGVKRSPAVGTTGRRGRGRPRKDASAAAKPVGRPRGRPPKNIGINGGAPVPVEAGGVDTGVLQVRRGRPAKVGALKKARRVSGRPVGRPKKKAHVEATQERDPRQSMAYQVLKSKLEHFQLKIKQAVGVIKPHLDIETASIAIGALQELQELATMDVGSRVNLGTQEPQPQTTEQLHVAPPPQGFDL